MPRVNPVTGRKGTVGTGASQGPVFYEGGDAQPPWALDEAESSGFLEWLSHRRVTGNPGSARSPLVDLVSHPSLVTPLGLADRCHPRPSAIARAVNWSFALLQSLERAGRVRPPGAGRDHPPGCTWALEKGLCAPPLTAHRPDPTYLPRPSVPISAWHWRPVLPASSAPDPASPGSAWPAGFVLVSSAPGWDVQAGAVLGVEAPGLPGLVLSSLCPAPGAGGPSRRTDAGSRGSCEPPTVKRECLCCPCWGGGGHLAEGPAGVWRQHVVPGVGPLSRPWAGKVLGLDALRPAGEGPPQASRRRHPPAPRVPALRRPVLASPAGPRSARTGGFRRRGRPGCWCTCTTGTRWVCWGGGHPRGSGRPVVGWAGPVRHSGLGARPLCAWPPSWARPHSSFLGPFLSRPSPGSDYKEAVAVAPGHPYGDEARAQEEPAWGGVGTLLGLPGGRTLNPGGCGCGSTAGSPGGPAGCGAEAEAGGRSPQALPRASPTRRPQPGLHTTWPPPAPTLGDVLVAGGPVENHTRPASALPPPPQHPLVRIVARPLTLVALPAPRGQLSGQRAGLGLSTPGWGHL